jgi:hypothetical protein
MLPKGSLHPPQRVDRLADAGAVTQAVAGDHPGRVERQLLIVGRAAGAGALGGGGKFMKFTVPARVCRGREVNEVEAVEGAPGAPKNGAGGVSLQPTSTRSSS